MEKRSGMAVYWNKERDKRGEVDRAAETPQTNQVENVKGLGAQ